MPSPEFVRAKIMACSHPEPNTGCWLWTLAWHRQDYGMLDRKVYGHCGRAHRIAFEAFRGPIPPGVYVLHKCDTPPCVNPEHLFLGTHSDNMADCARKGRMAPQRYPLLFAGERGSQARLTDDLVRFIRSSSASNCDLAREIGVHRSTVNNVRLRRTWAHI